MGRYECKRVVSFLHAAQTCEVKRWQSAGLGDCVDVYCWKQSQLPLLGHAHHAPDDEKNEGWIQKTEGQRCLLSEN